MNLSRLLLFAALQIAVPTAPPSPAVPPPPASLDAVAPPAAGAVRVLIVRHGQSMSNLDPPDIAPIPEHDQLTDLGRQQVERLSKALAGRTVARVLASPARRAQQTAAALAAALKTPAVATEERVRSMVPGRAADGRPLTFADRIKDWDAGRDPVVEGSESLAQVGARAEAAVKDAAAQGSGKAAVVIVAHSEVIGSLVLRLLGMPSTDDVRVPLASVTVVDVTPSKPLVLQAVGIDAAGTAKPAAAAPAPSASPTP